MKSRKLVWKEIKWTRVMTENARMTVGNIYTKLPVVVVAHKNPACVFCHYQVQQVPWVQMNNSCAGPLEFKR